MELKCSCSTDNVEIIYDEQGMPWIVVDDDDEKPAKEGVCTNCQTPMDGDSCFECGWW